MCGVIDCLSCKVPQREVCLHRLPAQEFDRRLPVEDVNPIGGDRLWGSGSFQLFSKRRRFLQAFHQTRLRRDGDNDKLYNLEGGNEEMYLSCGSFPHKHEFHPKTSYRAFG